MSGPATPVVLRRGRRAHASAPAEGPLVDAFGRVHDDLRISVTDRCNLRCRYCMPLEGMQFLPRETILSFEEIERVARIARSLGIVSVRLTGGEPLVRRRIVDLVSRLDRVGFEDLAMTTNGMSLARLAPGLAAAGLRRVNISCDSLDAMRFAEIRRGGDLTTVLRSMDAAEEAGLMPVKVNVVLIAGVNDDEVLDFAAFSRRTGRAVRFIEFMPLDAEEAWNRDSVVASEVVLNSIAARWPLEPIASEDPAPASRFMFSDGVGEIGVIASVTRPFCGTCNRLRLTAEGSLRNCLFSDDELSVRDVMRAGGSDDEVAQLFRQAVWIKRAGHGMDDPGFLRPHRSMSMIGG